MRTDVGTPLPPELRSLNRRNLCEPQSLAQRQKIEISIDFTHQPNRVCQESLPRSDENNSGVLVSTQQTWARATGQVRPPPPEHQGWLPGMLGQPWQSSPHPTVSICPFLHGVPRCGQAPHPQSYIKCYANLALRPLPNWTQARPPPYFTANQNS